MKHVACFVVCSWLLVAVPSGSIAAFLYDSCFQYPKKEAPFVLLFILVVKLNMSDLLLSILFSKIIMVKFSKWLVTCLMISLEKLSVWLASCYIGSCSGLVLWLCQSTSHEICFHIVSVIHANLHILFNNYSTNSYCDSYFCILWFCHIQFGFCHMWHVPWILKYPFTISIFHLQLPFVILAASFLDPFIFAVILFRALVILK